MGIKGKTARRIAVISGKGGVGKSVITANIAGVLSSLGRRILLVDADLGLANLDILLGMDPQFTIQDAFFGNHSLDEIVIPTSRGFDLLPAGSGMPEGTIYSQAMAQKIEAILKPLEARYDAILFDAGAGAGDVVLFFANLAHEILLVVTPEPTSLTDAYATIKILNQLHDRSEFLLVVNQADPACADKVGTAVAGHLQNVISRFIASPCPVRLELIGCIPRDPAVPDSIRHRQLLSESSPQSPSACLLESLGGFLDTRVHRAN